MLKETKRPHKDLLVILFVYPALFPENAAAMLSELSKVSFDILMSENSMLYGKFS
jgi:hypothetical protein